MRRARGVAVYDRGTGLVVCASRRAHLAPQRIFIRRAAAPRSHCWHAALMGSDPVHAEHYAHVWGSDVCKVPLIAACMRIGYIY